MTETLNLAQRLHAIMSDIHYIKKRPKAGLPYPFVAHDDVAEALRPLFIKHRVLCLPTVMEERQDGNRCVLKVTLNLYNIDDMNEVRSYSFVGHGIGTQDKSAGIATSYAIKTGLLKIFMIPTGEKDIEQDQIEHKPADPELVTAAADLIQTEDGAGLLELTDRLSDRQKIALWKEFNRATQEKMRELTTAARKGVE